MSREDRVELTGIISKEFKGGKYCVVVSNDEGSIDVICTKSGKLMMNKISLIVGDSVTVAVSPYDLQKGSIIWRNK